MTEIDRELNDKAAEMIKLMEQCPKSEQVTLLLNVITNVFTAGKESGRQEVYANRKEAAT